MKAQEMIAEAASRNGWDQGDVEELLGDYARSEGLPEGSVLNNVDTMGGHGRFGDFLSARAVMGSAFDLDV